MFYVTTCGICCVLIIFERQQSRLGSKISGYGQLAEVAVDFAMLGLPPGRSFADIPRARVDVRFSNRPVGVKHFQAIHHCSVDVSHGLALLFGIGARPFHHWRGGAIFRGEIARSASPGLTFRPRGRGGSNKGAEWICRLQTLQPDSKDRFIIVAPIFRDAPALP